MSDTQESRLARVEQELVGIGRELREIKARLDRSDEILTAIHKLTANHEHMLQELCEHDARLRVVESRPAKHWDALIGAGIGAGIAALAAWLLGK